MSMRPAQELVHESSKFSLRHFFESQAIRSPAELSSSSSEPLASHFPASASAPPPPPPSSFLRPHAHPHAPSVGAPLKDSKFTFTGLMPAATTPIQAQHKILHQHQQHALSQTATTNAKPSGLQSGNGNDVMRLKAQVLSLNERIAHSTANLTATSESVIRGNKALTTERAQFHSKYAVLTKKLEATQSALAEAEALPKEAVNNSKLLNAKVLELQLENGKLVATRDALMGQLSEKDADEIGQATNAHTEQDLLEMRSKFTSLSAQHSSLLDKQVLLEHELEAKAELLELAEGETADANERAEVWEAEVAELKGRFDASQLEITQTDSLVDALDEKLAAARMEAGAGAGVEPTSATTYYGNELQQRDAQIKQYTRDNFALFGSNRPRPGDRVLEQDSGRLGTVVEGGTDYGVAWHPNVLYDDGDGTPNAAHGESHYVVIEPGAVLPPMPWATNNLTGCCPATARCEEMEKSAREALNKTNGASEHECARLHDEWKFLDGMAKRARHALTTGEPERVVIAHVYTGTNASAEEPFDLASHIGANPLLMGKSIDESCLHCHTTMRATDAAVEARDTSCAEARTNAFVQAVSKDLKFSMDGSSALYASSASTGVALRV